MSKSNKCRKIKTLSIDRSKWAVPKNLKKKYGFRGVDAALLCEKDVRDEDGVLTGETESCGMKCCLGFLASALGASDSLILGVGMPSDLDAGGFPILEDYLKGPTDSNKFVLETFEAAAARLNDSVSIRPAAKEAKLKTLFSEVGIKLTFRGKYLDAK